MDSSFLRLPEVKIPFARLVLPIITVKSPAADKIYRLFLIAQHFAFPLTLSVLTV